MSTLAYFLSEISKLIGWAEYETGVISELFKKLKIFWDFVPYIITAAGIILNALAFVMLSFFGIYTVITALLMVFSIDRDPFRMFTKIYDRVLAFNIILVKFFIEITQVTLRVVQIAVQGLTNIIPFT